MLNREKGAAPLYSQIAEIIKSQIENGEFVKGDQFLTENWAATDFPARIIDISQ